MSHGHDDIDDMDDEEIRERLREELGAGLDDRQDDAGPRSGGCVVILLATPLIGWLLGG